MVASSDWWWYRRLDLENGNTPNYYLLQNPVKDPGFGSSRDGAQVTKPCLLYCSVCHGGALPGQCFCAVQCSRRGRGQGWWPLQPFRARLAAPTLWFSCCSAVTPRPWRRVVAFHSAAFPGPSGCNHPHLTAQFTWRDWTMGPTCIETNPWSCFVCNPFHFYLKCSIQTKLFHWSQSSQPYHVISTGKRPLGAAPSFTAWIIRLWMTRGFQYGKTLGDHGISNSESCAFLQYFQWKRYQSPWWIVTVPGSGWQQCRQSKQKGVPRIQGVGGTGASAHSIMSRPD